MAKEYKCLIVDDEKPAHKVILSHIDKFEELIIAESAYNGKEALQLIMQNFYDIVFLDIEMPTMSGLEVLQTLSKKPAIIITTAYSTFAFEAYQNDAVDYLLKPISLPRFVKAVEKAKKFCASNDLVEFVKAITVKVNGEQITIDYETISHIESIGNYVKIHLSNKKNYVVYDTLKSLESKLTSDVFLQIHKSFIVNINFIKRLEATKIILESVILPLGRKYELQIKKKFKV